MSASHAKLSTNDKQGNKRDLLVLSFGNAGTHNGAVEFIGSVPASGVDGVTTGNGWELVDVIVGALVNTTHTTTESITATVEKTDGGTSMLATAPVITSQSDPAHSNGGGSEAVAAVMSATQANKRLADGEGFIVTFTEAGSGGTDPSDTYVNLVFARLQDFDPAT